MARLELLKLKGLPWKGKPIREPEKERLGEWLDTKPFVHENILDFHKVQ